MDERFCPEISGSKEKYLSCSTTSSQYINEIFIDVYSTGITEQTFVVIFFRRSFSTIGILGRATDLLPSMRAPPDVS